MDESSAGETGDCKVGGDDGIEVNVGMGVGAVEGIEVNVGGCQNMR